MPFRRGMASVTLAEPPFGLVPGVGLAEAHLLGEIHALEPRPVARPRDQGRRVEATFGIIGDAALGRAEVAYPLGEATRVDARYPDEPHRAEPIAERLQRAPARGAGRVGPQHDAARRRSRGLDVLVVHADIADMREGEGDDLPRIGGIA